MKEWYFYQEKGRTMGPLTVEDLRVRVRDGRLRLFDLIYKEGESSWRMALEYSELRDEFKNHSTRAPADRPWVCLHRKSEENFDFITVGPFASGELVAALQSGELSYNDYVWKEGFSEWRRIGSVEDFNPKAARQARSETSRAERSEDLLRHVVELKRRPASEPALPIPPEAAGSDLTKSSDADDAEEIPDVEKILFNPNPVQTPTPRDVDATRIVRGGEVRSGPVSPNPEAIRVVNTTPKSAPVEPIFPSDDATRIVHSGTPPPLPEVPVRPRPGDAPTPRPQGPTPVHRPVEVPPLREEEEVGRRRMIADVAIVAVLVVVLAAAVIFVSRNMRAGRGPEHPPPNAQFEQLDQGIGELSPPQEGSAAGGPATLPPVSAPSAPPPNEIPAEPAEEPPPVEVSEATQRHTRQKAPETKAVPKKPTVLFLSASTNGKGVEVKVRTNGSEEYPVFLQVVGMPGHVADGASFYRYLQLKAKGNANVPLEVPEIRFPQGRYVVRVESGDLRREAPLALGTGEAAYRQSVAHARKTHAAVIWQERLALFRMAKMLEQSLSLAVASKKFQARGFESLNSVRKANGGKYALFDDWWEMKQIVQEARLQPTGTLLERARRLKDRMATFSVWRGK